MLDAQIIDLPADRAGLDPYDIVVYAYYAGMLQIGMKRCAAVFFNLLFALSFCSRLDLVCVLILRSDSAGIQLHACADVPADCVYLERWWADIMPGRGVQGTHLPFQTRGSKELTAAELPLVCQFYSKQQRLTMFADACSEVYPGLADRPRICR